VAEPRRHAVLADAVQPPDGGPLAMGEVSFVDKALLRGDPANAVFMAAVRYVLGVSPPVTSCHGAEAENCSVLWLAWDSWLVRGPDSEGEQQERGGQGTLAERLRDALADVGHVAVTDISEAETIIRLSGPQARLVLSKGCPLDLHARAFRPGEVRRSLLAGTDVILHLHRQAPEDCFDIYVRRSFAATLWRWLLQAGRAHGAGRLAG